MSASPHQQRPSKARRRTTRGQGTLATSRQRTGAETFFLPLVFEALEDRRLLSGSNDAAMLAAISSALSSSNSTGLASLGGKLRDSSVLARELPLLGTALGTRYDPAAVLGSLFGQLSGSFNSVGQLAGSLDAIPGIDLPQTPIDLANQLELRLHLTTQTTITAPLDDVFGSLHLDLNGAVDIT